MKIRKIERTDLNQLTELIIEHTEYEGFPMERFTRTNQLDKLIFSKDPALFVWVVERGRKLLGYMSATIDYSTWQAAPFVYLDCLYLREQARGQGVGWQLMTQLQEFAQYNDCNNIQWQTPPTNKLGISFYRKIGASESSKMRFTWSVDTQKIHRSALSSAIQTDNKGD